MVKRAVEMEGTVTGEHGVGLVKRDYLSHELGESTVDAMRRVSFLPFFLGKKRKRKKEKRKTEPPKFALCHYDD